VECGGRRKGKEEGEAAEGREDISYLSKTREWYRIR